MLKQLYKSIMVSLAIVVGVAVVTPAASAIDVFQSCENASDSAVCKSKGDEAPALIERIVNTMLFVLAGIAVIMIVIGGIKYTLSNGDQAGINSAKNTILYAVVGLIVAIMSYAIVNFVIQQLK